MDGEKEFKLVFNTDGEFLRAEAPNGKRVEEVTTAGLMSEKMYEIGEGESASLRDLLVLRRKDFFVQLIDVPGNSICAVRCGGRLFYWPC